MKKLITIALLFPVLAAQAQIMNVASIERLNVTGDDGKTNQVVAISPQGDYLLLSTDTKHGLVKWDIETARTSVLTTEPISASEVSISADGKKVFFGQVSYKDKKRYMGIESINLTNGKKKTLLKPARDIQAAEMAKVNRAMAAPSLKDDALSDNRPVLTHHHLMLYITRNGETKPFAPNGDDKHYIWSSLSPDETKVLYYVSGWGAYVCDLDGNQLVSMGDITAPKWWDNNTIVGMNEEADEYTVISSSIVARTLDGTEQILTGDDVIATYPLPCQQAGMIAFSTPDGDIYLIHVE